MQFSRLRLHNFKCYDAVDVELAAGTTVVYGVNGSGKSSLLEACFFALYGAEALPAGQTLDNVITKGATDTEVELWFDHGGERYQVERSLRVTDSQTLHEAALKTPEASVSGVTAVDEAIEELLRMSATDFLNCAYVRQGDITRLLMATPAERQRMIDELLQLGKLEVYRERMDNARVGVDRVRRDRASKLEDLREEITALEDQDLPAQRASLLDEREDLTSQIEAREADIEAKREEREAAIEALDEYEEHREELAEIEAALDEAAQARDEAQQRLDTLAKQIDTETERVAQEQDRASTALASTRVSVELDIDAGDDATAVGAVIDELEAAKAEVQTVIDELSSALQETREAAQEAAAEAHRLEDQANTVDSQAMEYAERMEDLSEAIAARQDSLSEHQEELADFEADIQAKQDRFEADDVPDDVAVGDADSYAESVDEQLTEVRDERQQLETKASTLRDRIEHAEQLLDAGKCPECGQSVEDAPEVSTLDEDRATLEDLEEQLEAIREEETALETEREVARGLKEVENDLENLKLQRSSVGETIEKVEAEIDEAQSERDQLREKVDEKRKAAAEYREEATAKEQERDTLLERVAETESELDEAEAELDSIDTAIDAVRGMREALTALENLRDRRADIRELREEHDATLAELRAEQEELEAAIDEAHIEALEAQRDDASAAIEELTDEVERLAAKKDEINKQLGRVEAQESELDRKRERAEALEAKVEVLDDLVDECVELEEMYGVLRRELRRRNVRQLEQLVNDIFSLVYQNDTYSHIELTDEYELRVIEKSGAVLAPDELSGGEKAIFNLALRTGIYQLLAEGSAGETPLPPLILDEPTVHLDAEHINRLSDLVARVRQLGVDQTIVVSHRPEIVDSADERIEVLQNPSTNRSRVNVESTDLLAGIQA